MGRIILAAAVTIVAATASISDVRAASFLDLIRPDGAPRLGGSFGTPGGVDPAFGPPGVVIDSQRDFRISAASVGLVVNGTVNASVRISGRGPGSSGTAPLLQTANVTGADPFGTYGRLTAGAFNAGDVWHWYDIPIDFAVRADQAHRVEFPVRDYEIVSGTGSIGTSTSPNGVFVYGLDFAPAAHALAGPHTVGDVLTVSDGTMNANDTAMVLAGLLTDRDGVLQIDRTVGFTSDSGSDPVATPIPLPGALPLFGLALGMLATGSYVRSRKGMSGSTAGRDPSGRSSGLVA